MLLVLFSVLLNAVIPKVEIIASHSIVIVGQDDVIIECIVLRGNPSNYFYSITNVDTGNTTLDPFLVLTKIQVTDLGTYRCDVTNDAGKGSVNVTIKQGGM